MELIEQLEKPKAFGQVDCGNIVRYHGQYFLKLMDTLEYHYGSDYNVVHLLSSTLDFIEDDDLVEEFYGTLTITPLREEEEE